MFNRIDHVEVVVHDLAKSIEFYTEKLGFCVLSRSNLNSSFFNEAVMLGQNDIKIELLSTHNSGSNLPPQVNYGIRLAALSVTCMRKVLDKLAHQGVHPVWGPRVIGDAIRAEICDFEGNLIELRQQQENCVE
ncbi:VOC family protein [Psychrobium sp. 1_MG-2023]|uniref:VOC family protein n=1 Tax=Psychrobium sp. 1_MG-2023 TaxID=3062624 RepID=UPI000C34DA56|nr:VOC family protein [Psychrobium sp. 1_MG-2023]MDP2562667.1 VOC family protein [Psychrobium sp. 1_MG-2023]PKF53805.1 lactoylglutathione lyase [Alteromonadales bacterium alter-6D02]